jgi:hypothetical protein
MRHGCLGKCPQLVPMHRDQHEAPNSLGRPCRLRRIRPKEEALTPDTSGQARGGLPHIFAMYGQKSAEAIVGCLEYKPKDGDVDGSLSRCIGKRTDWPNYPTVEANR